MPGLFYPALCSAVTVEAGVNDSIGFQEGGGNLVATLTPGTYYLDDVGGGTLGPEILVALNAAGGFTYSAFSYSLNYTAGQNAGTVSILASGSWRFRTSGTTFDLAQIGFVSNVDGLPLGFQNSDSSPSLNWASNQPVVKFEPGVPTQPAVEHIAPNGSTYVFVGGSVREFRADRYELVAGDRIWKFFADPDNGRTLENFWQVVNDGRAIRLYHDEDPPGVLVSSELVGTFRLTGDALTQMPNATRRGRTNLYDFNLPMRAFV